MDEITIGTAAEKRPKDGFLKIRGQEEKKEVSETEKG